MEININQITGDTNAIVKLCKNTISLNIKN